MYHLVVLTALSDDDIIKIHEKFEEILNIGKFWFAVLRDIGWAIIYQLAKLLDALSIGQKGLTDLIEFYKSDQFVSFIGKYEFLTWGLAGLGLLFLFYKLISTKKKETDTILNNFVIAITMSLALPMLMAQGSELFKLGRDFESSETPPALTIVKNNLVDVYKIDKDGWKLPDGAYNDIGSMDDLKYIDMSEVVDTGGWFFDDSPLSDKGKEILEKKTIKINQKVELANLESRIIRADEAYFRYSWHPFIMTIDLLIFIFVILFFMFKFSYLALQSGILLGFFQATAYTDLSSGKRNLMVLDKIKNIFIVAYFMLFMQSILNVYFQYINAQDLNSLLALIAKLGGAFLCLQGPDFIEQIFGIDGGSGNMAQSFMAMKQGLDGVGQLARGTKNAIANGAGAVVGASKGIGKSGLYGGSFLKGLKDGFQDKGGNGKSNPLGPDEKGGSKKSNPSNQNEENKEKNPTNTSEKSDNQSDKSTGSKKNNKSQSMSPSDNKRKNDNQTTNPLENSESNSSRTTNPLENSESNDSRETNPLENNESNDNRTTNPFDSQKSEDNKPTGPLNEDKESISHQSNEKSHDKDNQSRKDDTFKDVVSNKISNVRNNVNNSNTVRKANRIYDVTKNTVKQKKGKGK